MGAVNRLGASQHFRGQCALVGGTQGLAWVLGSAVPSPREARVETWVTGQRAGPLYKRTSVRQGGSGGRRPALPSREERPTRLAARPRAARAFPVAGSALHLTGAAGSGRCPRCDMGRPPEGGPRRAALYRRRPLAPLLSLRFALRLRETPGVQLTAR